jgi:integrating conjugative element protein (TIGR03757 family)
MPNLAAVRALPAFVTGFMLVAMPTISPASEFFVVTDRTHPVNVAPDIRVVELDGPVRIIKSELSRHLPSDPVQAAAIARARMEAGGAALQRRLRLAYQGVLEAWSLGVTQIPAVIVDRRYVVYGEPDVNHAISLIEQYRSKQP